MVGEIIMRKIIYGLFIAVNLTVAAIAQIHVQGPAFVDCASSDIGIRLESPYFYEYGKLVSGHIPSWWYVDYWALANYQSPAPWIRVTPDPNVRNRVIITTEELVGSPGDTRTATMTIGNEPLTIVQGW